MSNFGDVAETVVAKTSRILSRIEEDLRELLPEQLMVLSNEGQIQLSPRLKEFDVAEIREEINAIKALTGRLAPGDAAKRHSDQLPPSQEAQEKHSTTPALPEVIINSSDSSSLSEDIKTQKRTVRKKKSKRKELTEDLYKKIENLEKEIAALRSARKIEREIKGRDVLFEGLDLDSMTNPSGSPVKSKRLAINERGSVEGIPHLDFGSMPSVSPPKKSAVQATFTVRREKGKGGKSLLVETEKIVDEGFKTARDINEKLQGFKGGRVSKKKSRDVASQVSIRHKHHKDKYNERLIQELENKVDSLVRDCRHCHHPPNTSFQHIHAPETPLAPSRPNLTAQKLPNVNIPGCLTRQLLPSVQILPPEKPPPSLNNNAVVTVLEHGKKPSIASKSERSDSIECLLREVLAIQDNSRRDVFEVKNNAEIGLQTSLSRRSSFCVDDRLENLTKKFQNRLQMKMNSDRMVNDEVGDLLNQVTESKEKCRRYGERRKKKLFLDRLKDDKLIHKSNENAPQVKHSSVKNSARTSDSQKNTDLDDYESDFELESLQLDEAKPVSARSDRNTSSSRSATERDRNKTRYVEKGRPLETERHKNSSRSGKLGSLELPVDLPYKTIPIPQVIPRNREFSIPKTVSPLFSPVVPSDGSIIEEHMKKLGLSPSRRTGALSKEPDHRIKHHNEVGVPIIPAYSSDNSTSHQPLAQKLYIKSNGKFIPVDPLKAPNVNIIVPEIVVNIPEKRNDIPVTNPSSTPAKLDQLVQTDEGCGTLTSVDTASVVEKISGHFERTQMLLERLAVGSSDGPLPRRRRKQKTLLDNLHVRADSEEESSSSSSLRYTSSQQSLRGAQLRERARKVKKIRNIDRFNVKSDGEEGGNLSRSIGEVLSSDCR